MNSGLNLQGGAVQDFVPVRPADVRKAKLSSARETDRLALSQNQGRGTAQCTAPPGPGHVAGDVLSVTPQVNAQSDAHVQPSAPTSRTPALPGNVSTSHFKFQLNWNVHPIVSAPRWAQSSAGSSSRLYFCSPVIQAQSQCPPPPRKIKVSFHLIPCSATSLPSRKLIEQDLYQG